MTRTMTQSFLIERMEERISPRWSASSQMAGMTAMTRNAMNPGTLVIRPPIALLTCVRPSGKKKPIIRTESVDNRNAPIQSSMVPTTWRNFGTLIGSISLMEISKIRSGRRARTRSPSSVIASPAIPSCSCTSDPPKKSAIRTTINQTTPCQGFKGIFFLCCSILSPHSRSLFLWDEPIIELATP